MALYDSQRWSCRRRSTFDESQVVNPLLLGRPKFRAAAGSLVTIDRDHTVTHACAITTARFASALLLSVVPSALVTSTVCSSCSSGKFNIRAQTLVPSAADGSGVGLDA